MDHFMDPEIIAGAILAFYFFARAASSLFDRHTGKSSPSERELEEIKHNVLCIKSRIEEWDDMIRAGDFSSVWTQKEVYEILDKADQILADGPWTANLNRNYEKLKEIKYLLDQIAISCSRTRDDR